MKKARLKYLRQEANAERLDLVEISEIENAFSKLPDGQLRDLRENATVDDMLDEIEAASSKFEVVKIQNPVPTATGWEVKTRQGDLWFTVCDTYACHGKSARYWANRIAEFLNSSR